MMWDRDLRGEEDADEALHEDLKSSIEDSIYGIQRHLGMFKTEGWDQTKAILKHDLHLAMASLASPRLKTIQQVEFVRGQIHAYQQLLGMEDFLRQRLSRHSGELHSLHASEITTDPDEPGP